MESSEIRPNNPHICNLSTHQDLQCRRIPTPHCPAWIYLTYRIQPIYSTNKIQILEFIHITKYNHKLFNLIQNTNHDFSVGTEELNTIKALKLLWPLLETKNIIRILAKLLTTSDSKHDIFPHGFKIFIIHNLLLTNSKKWRSKISSPQQ